MKYLILTALIFTLYACSKKDELIPDNPHNVSVSFESMGLEGKVVHDLIATESVLIAATDQGIYKSNFNSNWTPLGLQNRNVVAVSIIDANTIICSVTDEHQLLKSDDFGQSWSVVQSNFGGGTPERIYVLRYNPETNELLATGRGVIASSFDTGHTWIIRYGFWNAIASGLFSLEINPSNNQAWAGGQNAIESQVIIQLDSNRQTINQWTEILPSPSTVERFAFNCFHHNRIILGCEGGILLTNDNGLSWQSIYSDSSGTARFYYGLVYDNLNSDRIIAASWDKDYVNPQPLLLHISNDNGQTWSEISADIPLIYGGTRDMLQRQENGKTVLYLGLWKGGVYKVKNLP